MLLPDLYSIFLQYPSIQTDTRKLQPGDLFFALKGPLFNGNQFAKQALDAGAAYVIIDEPVSFTDTRIIETTDALQLLQDLAKYHRQQFDIPFIAITGSNGKTTTKELLHEVLASTYTTYSTKGNLNNHIGIPLTILAVKKDAAIAIIEMGANHQQEIAGYCQYTLPTHGIITNCGKAHLEGFGGEAGVIKGKGELFDYLKLSGGTAFIMNDYAYLKKMSEGISTIKTYGTETAEITGVVDKSGHFLQVVMTNGTSIKKIKTNLVGEYNAVSDKAIQNALEHYFPSNSRSQLIEKEGNQIILDAYNANPSSMKAAIENFASMGGDDKVLLLGAMMELGNESIAEHISMVDLIDQYRWKAVVLVGGDFKNVPHRYLYFQKVQEAKEWLQQQAYLGVKLLIKGSRSIQMEKVLE